MGSGKLLGNPARRCRGAADGDRLARINVASTYDKEYMTIELAMPKEPGNIYAGDEAGFLAQAMASGLEFHKMVADARLGLG